MDCFTCPFRRNGNLSLNHTIEDEHGNEIALIDTIPDDAPLFSDILADQEHLRQLLNRLNEIMPLALAIGRLRLQGMSDTAIATEIGVHRNTFASRIKKAESILKKEFPELF